MKPIVLFFVSLLLLLPSALYAQEDVSYEPAVFNQDDEGPTWAFTGEATAYAIGASGDLGYNLLGVRYLPRLTFEAPLRSGIRFDAEAQAHLYGWQASYEGRSSDDDQGIEAHRLWGRVYTDQFGLRLGLQEIRFGHSKLLRSLQWFDTYDYRDPTGFTEGVRAALARWYGGDSSSLWVWFLYADQDAYYGQQLFRSYGGHPELGGRYQWPAGSGELAVSLHRRSVNLGSQVGQLGETELAHENRLAFDVQQDWGVGFWFEGVYNQRSKGEEIFTREERPNWDTLFTLGLDYTFANLDGLYALAEWQSQSTGGEEGGEEEEEGFGLGEDADSNLALSATLPLGISDQVRLMLLSRAASSATHSQIDWTHSTDHWVYGLVGFSQSSDLGGASGVQLLVQYNH